MSLLERGLPCPANNPAKWEEQCNSSDAMALYLDETEDGEERINGKCYSCEQKFSQNRLASVPELVEQFGIKRIDTKGGGMSNPTKYKKKKRRPNITLDEIEYLKDLTESVHQNFRGIEDKYHNLYGIRSQYDNENKMIARLYPNTIRDSISEEITPSSYKKRTLPKDFSSGLTGYNGNENMLFGACRFQNGGKYLLIVGGEEDCPAAYKMLREDQEGRGKADLPPVAVVAPSVGETGCKEQIKNNYWYLDQFDVIVLCLDNDEKGREAVDKLLPHMPREKVRVMECPVNDPCEALKAGKQKQFVNNFYRAKEKLATGVTGSGDIRDKMIQELSAERLPLPPFMSEAQEMMGGGIPLGRIINVAAQTSVGKTTVINEIIYYWIFNSPYKPAILSMELDDGEFGTAMLSRHTGTKIDLMPTASERLDYVNKPDIIDSQDELMYDDDGNHRFMMVEAEFGKIKVTQDRILTLIIQHGVKVIVIDPLSDLLDGMSPDEQAVFMGWQKFIVKKYKVIFFNILHVRKGQGDNSGKKRIIGEDDVQGSSAIIKSASLNMIIARDKLAEDEVMRNTIYAIIPKCRWTGETGEAGQWYYEKDSHRLHDKATYFESLGEVVNQVIEPTQEIKELTYEMSRG